MTEQAKKWAIIAERKRQRKAAKEQPTVFAWQKWIKCELCDHAYCINNYQDHKPRIKKWRGLTICPWCQFRVIPAVNRLKERKLIKFRKSKP